MKLNQVITLALFMAGLSLLSGCGSSPAPAPAARIAEGNWNLEIRDASTHKAEDTVGIHISQGSDGVLTIVQIPFNGGTQVTCGGPAGGSPIPLTGEIRGTAVTLKHTGKYENLIITGDLVNNVMQAYWIGNLACFSGTSGPALLWKQ